MPAGFIGFRPTVTAGTGGVAPGAWNLREVFNQRRANLWPEHTSDAPAAVDSLWGAVRLLVPFDTSANSVTHSDGQSITGTTSGTSGSPASAVTSDYKYGTGGWTHYQGTVTYSTGTFNSTNWTVEFWFKRNANYSFTNNRQVMKFGDFIFRHTNSNYFGIYDDDDESSIGSFGTAALNTWEHYAIVYQNGTMRLYKGGVQVASSTGTLSAPSSVVIGRSSYPLYNFSIDELRVTDASRYPSGTSFSVPQAAHGTSSGTGKLDVNTDNKVRCYLHSTASSFEARANTTTGYYKITNGSNSVISQESQVHYPTYYYNTNTYYGTITTRPRLTSVDTSAVVIIESCTSSGTASGNIQGIDIGTFAANKVKEVDISGCGVLTTVNAGATGGSPARTKPAGGPGGSRVMASLIEEIRAVGVGASLAAGGYSTHHSGTVNVYGGGIDLWNQQLDAAALNQLYTDLATTSVSGTRGVFVGSNPGTGSDNPSIATGYTIYGS